MGAYQGGRGWVCGGGVCCDGGEPIVYFSFFYHITHTCRYGGQRTTAYILHFPGPQFMHGAILRYSMLPCMWPNFVTSGTAIMTS